MSGYWIISAILDSACSSAIACVVKVSTFNLPSAPEYLYVVKKTSNTIGIKTGLGNNFNEVSAYITTDTALNDGDNVIITGLSTSQVKGLAGNHVIGINTAQTIVYKEIPNSSTTGIVTDIYVTSVPENISAGSSIGIGTEKFLVLKKFEDKSALRVKRGVTGTAHTVSSLVKLIPSFFSLSVKSDYFESKVNDKVFFNPVESVGVSTNVGVGTTVSFQVGVVTTTVDVPSQSIFLPNHPFKNNQQVTLTKPGPGLALTVSNTSGGAQFNLPLLGNTQTLYVINKSNR